MSDTLSTRKLEPRTQDPELGIASDPRISKLLADAERRWGRGALVRWGDALERDEVEVIPTGFPFLDEALGIGGLPCGRISEIFGPDSSGKQALVAGLVVQCQKLEGVAAYVDPARRLDPEQMRVQGVDFHSLLVAHPGDRLQALEMAIRLARSGGIRLMIFDSSLITHHSSLSLALRRLVSAVDRNGIAFVFLNEGADQGGHGGSPLHAWPRGGGQAFRFFASVRLAMERREWIRRGREVVGCRSLIRVIKNKLAPPLKEAEVDLIFYRFPPDMPALQLCRPTLPHSLDTAPQQEDNGSRTYVLGSI